MTGGGADPPPPPPDEEHALKPANEMAANPATTINMPRLRRTTRGRNTTARTGTIAPQPSVAAGLAAADAWLVVICRLTLPVPFAATVVLDGLNTHAAYDGNVPHCIENAAEDPLVLLMLRV